MGEVIEENDLGRHIRYRHRIDAARWSSARRTAGRSRPTRTDTGEAVRFTADFLWMCQGYYRHAEGYTPEWPGMDGFKGRIVHPQTWPEDLDYKGKRVVVIGSGATAATLVPAIADDCAHVTLLQRSPTYFIAGRNANRAGRHAARAGASTRPGSTRSSAARSVHDQDSLHPPHLRRARARSSRSCWPASAPTSARTTTSPRTSRPTYRPWRQRIAFVPDGDLFQAIAAGKASVVTDQIERFTRDGHPA